MTALKARFSTWLILLLLVLVGLLVKMLGSGLALNTNMLALLPGAGHQPGVQQAVERFSTYMGNRVIFLVGNASGSKARAAAAQFRQQLADSKHFQSLSQGVSNTEQQAWGKFYFPYRLQLLTRNQRQQLEKGNSAAIRDAALMKLYSPTGGTTALLQQDPFFLFQDYLASRPQPASRVSLVNGELMARHNERWYVLQTATLKQNSFSIEAQQQAIQTIKQAEQTIKDQYPHTRVRKTGMLFYAHAGTEQARGDIATIGIGSIIGIILLILLTFRSLRPLLLILFSSLCGFVTAVVVTSVVFDELYLFTMAFGASLIGISVDYAFFYYADRLLGGPDWQAQRGLARIIPGTGLGLLNVVLAYVIMAFTPFPGLKQLAVFAISGLGMAWLTVICAFPCLLTPGTATSTPLLLRATSGYLAWCRRCPRWILGVISLIVAIIASSGMLLLHPDDNVRILEKMPTRLKQNEQAIKTIIGNHTGHSFFVVSAPSRNTLLTREQHIRQALQQHFPGNQERPIAVSDYVPPLQVQQRNYQLVQQQLIKHTLLPYLQKIGLSAEKARSVHDKLAQMPFRALTVEDWLHSPVSQSLRFLWLGPEHGRYYSIMLLPEHLAHAGLRDIAGKHSGVTFINRAEEVSAVFQHYRVVLSWLLGLMLCVLFVFFSLRYGLKKAVLYSLPPLAAELLALAATGLAGFPLTLFTILALILVLGLGVDYVLFFAESRSSYQATMLAVTLSALTTLLSFGLLALSQTPVIHFFGLSVTIGIASAFILAPMVTRLTTPGSR